MDTRHTATPWFTHTDHPGYVLGQTTDFNAVGRSVAKMVSPDAEAQVECTDSAKQSALMMGFDEMVSAALAKTGAQ